MIRGTAHECQYIAKQPLDHQFSKYDIQGHASRIDETMRTRSILILASVASILVMAGMGNAFAATYSGTAFSELENNGLYSYVAWNSQLGDGYAGNQEKQISGGGDNLYWNNELKNDLAYWVHGGIQGSSCDFAKSYGSTVNGAYGVWGPTQMTATLSNPLTRNPTYNSPTYVAIYQEYYRTDAGFNLDVSSTSSQQSYYK